MQHAWRLSRPEGAQPCLGCGATQPQPPRVTRHKTRGEQHLRSSRQNCSLVSQRVARIAALYAEHCVSNFPGAACYEYSGTTGVSPLSCGVMPASHDARTAVRCSGQSAAQGQDRR
jgi:hypothetical protein